MKLIKFRRIGRKYWEIAFNEKQLYEKLHGEMAEIHMPTKPLVVRLWYKLFPMRFVKEKVDNI
jgi:hypothetical protein